MADNTEIKIVGRRPKTERNALIVKMRDEDKRTWKEIGEEFNITFQTAHEIYEATKRREARIREFKEAQELSTDKF